MFRRLLRWIAPVYCLICQVSTLYAQSRPSSSSGDEPNRAPAVPYAIAVLFTIVVMVILCTPSRKHFRK
jgi:hypothetical protein